MPSKNCWILFVLLAVLILWPRPNKEGFDGTAATNGNLNFVFADSTGNLQTTTTSNIGFVGSGAQFSGSAVTTNTPDGTTRINNQGIIFGGTNNNRETNSASISAGGFVPDTLCFVGMSDGTKAASTRKIRMWAEGGLSINGPVATDNKITATGFCIGSTCITEDHLKLLTGGKSFQMKSTCNGDTLYSGSSWNATTTGFDSKNDSRSRWFIGQYKDGNTSLKEACS